MRNELVEELKELLIPLGYRFQSYPVRRRFVNFRMRNSQFIQLFGDCITCSQHINLIGASKYFYTDPNFLIKLINDIKAEIKCIETGYNQLKRFKL